MTVLFCSIGMIIFLLFAAFTQRNKEVYDGSLIFLTPNFRSTPQWLLNEYQQKQSGESNFVSFVEMDGTYLFRIEENETDEAQCFNVTKPVVWGDYCMTDEYVFLFDQGTFFPAVSRSILYAFQRDGELVYYIELEEGFFFSSVSGIVFDSSNKTLFMVLEQQEIEGDTSNILKFYLTRFDIMANSSFILLNEWEERVAIIGVDSNHIILKSNNGEFCESI